MKTSSKIWLTIIVLIVLVIAFGLVRRIMRVHDGVHYQTQSVGYQNITTTVTETGTVNPVDEVSIGTQVSGTIASLEVDYNSKVTKGEVLATLDPTTYQAAVSLAKANLEAANANVGKAKAQLDLANITVERDIPLFKKNFITPGQMDSDQASAASAQQDYLAALAAVKVAKAQLTQAQYNLSQTVIRSPVDGVVIARNVSIGQTVAASLQTPTLFTIGTNLTRMQIDTSVDEADVERVHVGDTALISFTAFPNTTFTGKVMQIRINPNVVQNVVTYDAVVSVDDNSGKLFPGMTAQEVDIVVGTRSHVLAIPVAAVLYRPLGAYGESQSASLGAGVLQSDAAAGGFSAASNVAGTPGSHDVVWTLQGGRAVPVSVTIGLSDERYMEVTGGNLHAGDLVIVGQTGGGTAEEVAAERGAGCFRGSSGGEDERSLATH